MRLARRGTRPAGEVATGEGEETRGLTARRPELGRVWLGRGGGRRGGYFTGGRLLDRDGPIG